jgi:hypothetical protein
MEESPCVRDDGNSHTCGSMVVRFGLASLIGVASH